MEVSSSAEAAAAAAATAEVAVVAGDGTGDDSGNTFDVNWDELLLYFEEVVMTDQNDAENEDEHFATTIIPMVQVDTNCGCSVLIAPPNKNTDDKKRRQRVVMEEPPTDYTYHITVLLVTTPITTEAAPEATTSTTSTTTSGSATTGYTIHFYSTNVTAVERTVQELFAWLTTGTSTTSTTTSSVNNSRGTTADTTTTTVTAALADDNSVRSHRSWAVTIQTFAKQPRQVLPIIFPMAIGTTNISGTHQHHYNHSQHIRSLRICYFTITEPLLDWTSAPVGSNNNGIEGIELIQCTMQCDWNIVLSSSVSTTTALQENDDNIETIDNHLLQPQTQCLDGNNNNNNNMKKALTMSCPLHELIKSIAFLSQSSPPDDGIAADTTTMRITELHFLLHFCIPDDIVKSLTTALATSPLCAHSLTTISIHYLDLSDRGWEVFCTTLIQHAATLSSSLQSLSLQYTDNFVDAYRRMTVDRCTTRTVQLLQVIQAIPSIRHIDFPIYQQDTTTMQHIHTLLNERRLIE